jgi:hypothetical protein
LDLFLFKVIIFKNTKDLFALNLQQNKLVLKNLPKEFYVIKILLFLHPLNGGYSSVG